MRLRLTAWAATAAIALTLMASGRTEARADENEPDQTPARSSEEVRALFERGSRAFRAGEYEAAVRAFHEAYDRSRIPALLFNLAQAQRMNGDCAGALVSYRRYVELAPEAPNRIRTDARIRELEAQCGQASNPEKQHTVPSRPTAEPAPPKSAAPLFRPVNPVTEESPRGSRLKVTGYLLAGAAVALATGAAVFSWKAASAANSTSDLFARGGSWDAQARATEQEGRRSERLAIVLYSAAGVAAVAGVWSFVAGVRSPIVVTPRIGGGGEAEGAVVEGFWAF